MNEMIVFCTKAVTSFLSFVFCLGLIVFVAWVFAVNDKRSENTLTDIDSKPKEEPIIAGSINVTQNNTTVNHITVNNITNIEVREDSDHEH